MKSCFENLIFDIDGTLWNTTDVVATAWNQAIRESKIDKLKDLVVTGDRLKKEFGKPMDVIADNLFGNIDANLKADLLANCCVLEHKAIEDNNDDLTYPQISETLKELSKKHNLYIVSNCQDGYIELVMSKLGITDIINDIECFGHTGLQKDENITLLMRRNNISNAVYIGDTIGDYNATKKAGLPFVFAKYGFGDVDNPDYVIDNPSELLKLVD